MGAAASAVRAAPVRVDNSRGYVRRRSYRRDVSWAACGRHHARPMASPARRAGQALRHAGDRPAHILSLAEEEISEDIPEEEAHAEWEPCWRRVIIASRYSKARHRFFAITNDGAWFRGYRLIGIRLKT